MNTAGVIRSQRKIEAVINNARIFQKIRNEFGSFSQYIWSWSGGKALLYRGHELGNLPASNELSDKISADLKKRGMKFLGSVGFIFSIFIFSPHAISTLPSSKS